MNDAPAPTYYDQPLLNKPHWDGKVAAYLFVGGAMGGCGMLAAFARRSGDTNLERSSRYLSLALAGASPAILVAHLGRPERFHHMLRIVKLKSPMSLGAWSLVFFSIPAVLNALAQAARDGVLPKGIARFVPERFCTLLQAFFGTFITGYTGVLLSATAIPLWAKGKYHIPALGVCSAVSTACALNALALCRDGAAAGTLHKLDRLKTCASLGELGVLLHFYTYGGKTVKPLFTGACGERLRKFTVVGGILVPVLLNAASVLFGGAPRRGVVPCTLAASGLTLLGGYVLRAMLLDAGKASADDPREAFVQPA